MVMVYNVIVIYNDLKLTWSIKKDTDQDRGLRSDLRRGDRYRKNPEDKVKRGWDEGVCSMRIVTCVVILSLDVECSVKVFI